MSRIPSFPSSHSWSWLLEAYISFEQRVQEEMNAACQPYCSICSSCCCRENICRENRASPFLRILSWRRRPQGIYDRKRGWLSPQGCRLAAGRPPVCYSFMCHRVFRPQGSDRRRYALDVLARLVEYIGEHALNGRHLVELERAGDLRRVDTAAFRRRLEEAEEAFTAVLRVLRDEPLSPSEMVAMRVLEALPDYLDEATLLGTGNGEHA